MEYTIIKLSKIAGISTRTLRYYDEIDLLKPLRINSSGYRIYGKEEIEKLQQIMFYRELGVKLEEIKNILSSPLFEGIKALKEHRDELMKKRGQLDILILNVTKSIEEAEGGKIMSDIEKFEGFKKKAIDDNERKYGSEIREKFGETQVNISNNKFMNMTKEQFEKTEALNNEILTLLKEAFISGDPSSALAQRAANLHKEWLSLFWGSYSKEAHAQIAQMYVDDVRFTEYYDKHQSGLAKFLRDAVMVYTGIK